jgi:exodeoxyribonuclease-3
MKIATFNINNVNKRLASLLDWLRSAKPDVVALQELKAADAEFPAPAIEQAGYGAVWRGQKSWNGVAILARGCEPIVTRTQLPGERADAESRYIEAAVRGVLIASLYAPNGNPQPGPKFAHKLAWMKRLAAHAEELYGADIPVVLAGDYNVVPTDRDIYPTTSYAKDALLQPESRALFRRILDQGWVDAIRALHPDAPMYTFWDYMRNRWPRDAGLRIDHLLLSAQAAKRLLTAGVDRKIRGKEGASDHAPAWAVLREEAKARRNSRSLAKTAPRSTRRKASAPTRRPLLVIDGDSFAHRAYHALPKTILRRGGRPAGAILGFANFLLKFYRAEQPRAVLVCWDTLDAPTYRHEKFPAYQSGREFDDAVLEQLECCRNSSPRAALPTPRPRATRPMISSPRRSPPKSGAAAARWSPAATAIASSLRRPARPSFIQSERARSRGSVRPRFASATASIPAQVPDFIALRGDPSDRLPGVAGLGAAGAAQVLQTYGTLEKALRAGRFAAHAARLRLFRSLATMDHKAKLPRLADQRPSWGKAAALARDWELKQLAGRLEELATAADRAGG